MRECRLSLNMAINPCVLGLGPNCMLAWFGLWNVLVSLCVCLLCASVMFALCGL